MIFPSLQMFLKTHTRALGKGPVAVICVEDQVEVTSTLRHHLDLGFPAVLVLAPDTLSLPDELRTRVHHINYDMHRPGALADALNALIRTCPAGTWLYYCFNGEYLFFPFCEHRSVRELLEFHSGERRDAMLSYVIDLYADDLTQNPNGVNRAQAMFDRGGYYALKRWLPGASGPLERQYDIFGGLRWRFEEHIPRDKRRIDRISLFRTAPGLTFRTDHTLSDEEYNTIACPWHHNLTAAVMSFRTAKALKQNPASAAAIRSFHWFNSTRFEWNSRQLMNLGLTEPGQWF